MRTRIVTASCLAAAMVSFSPVSSIAGPSGAEAWISNGATACQKFLTPDVVAGILSSPPGPPRQNDATSCSAGTIYIRLSVANMALFQHQSKVVGDANTVSGIGDAAYWNHAGALASVKGPDRGCEINIISGAKLQGEALAKKVGEICNKLYALP